MLPPPEPSAVRGVRFVWFIVAPDGGQLREIAALLDTGQRDPIVDHVFPLTEARAADTVASQGHARGKIVLKVRDDPPPR